MPSISPLYKVLELVENQYSDRDYIIKISVPEFTCACPRSGRPDFATIEINYIPDAYIVELKSLKLYIHGFRDIGIFHEDVTNKIMDDFRMACHPRKIDVTGRFNPRGGIKTDVRVNWPE